MKLIKWTLEETMAIVLEGLNGQKPVEICREHQINQSLFYPWRDRFREFGQKRVNQSLGWICILNTKEIAGWNLSLQPKVQNGGKPWTARTVRNLLGIKKASSRPWR